MRIFYKSLKRISILQSDVFKNNSTILQRKSFSSKITPVKMAADVFQSETTDRNATPLLIMHGLFGSKRNWKSVSQQLEGKIKRKIYSVDARNHGDSPHVPLHNSASMAEDIKFLMKEENLKKLCVLGHSVAGRTMMFLALNYPELVEKVIIVDASPVSVPSDLSETDKIFLAMKNVKIPPKLTMAEGRAMAEKQMKEQLQDMKTFDFILANLKKSKSGDFVWRLNVDALLANFSEYTKKQDEFRTAPFTGPVLFIAGKKSPFINPDDWPEIKQRFPNAKLEWLENAGHLVHFDQPDKFIELVTNFLKN